MTPGAQVVKSRLFEWELTLACRHQGDEVPVYGNGTPQWHRKRLGRSVTIDEKRAAMGIDWMNRDELSQAIPPAYAEWLGRAAIRHLARS